MFFRRFFMKKLVLFALVSSLVLLSPALAQAPGGPNPAMRERFEALRPVFELMQSINLALEVDKQKGLAFNKPQAQKFLPVLKDLRTRADLKPKDAEKILTTIEDKILTAKQLQWIDDTRLKREEERRKRMAANNGGGFGQGGPGGGAGAGGGQGGPGGAMFQAVMSGKPFNPFKDAEMGKSCVELLALLEKR
jgi:uncharacterized membrane protein YgcG